MYTRKQLLEELEERYDNQSKIVNERPNDIVAYRHLSQVRENINRMKDFHVENDKNDSFLVFQNEDYRLQGNDHSEVSRTPIFRCCNSCARALQFWLGDNIDRGMGMYYSIGRDEGQEIDKKIVVYQARSLVQSMDSDEMRINNEWLD